MTKQEIEKEHMVWHVNHILIDLFRVDAKLNLPAHLLKPPPKKQEPDPPPSPGEESGSGGQCKNGTKSSNKQSQGDRGSNSPKISEVDNTRQNSMPPMYRPEEEDKIVPNKSERQEFKMSSNIQDISTDPPENDMGTMLPESSKTNASGENKGEDESSIESKKVEDSNEGEKERKRQRSGDSDIQEVEQDRVPTPDIIDLLDSDPEEENTKDEEGNLMEESICPTVNNNLVVETPAVITDDNVPIPTAPRLIERKDGLMPESELSKPPRAVARKHTASFATKTNIEVPENEHMDKSYLSQADTSANNPEHSEQVPTKKRAVARKRTGPRSDSKKRKQEDIFSLAVEKVDTEATSSQEDIFSLAVKEADIEATSSHLPIARKSIPEVSATNSSIPPVDMSTTLRYLQPVLPAMLTGFQAPSLPTPSFITPTYHQPQPGPSQIIYRGKFTNVENMAKPSSGKKGVRKHNHIPWTMTGLKKAETFAVVKEEKAVHTCDVCGVKYEKFRSLEIHKRRSHNENLKVECPEGCGKLLSNTNAIKKHLLSHRPEEEWPYECPLCHKKFQARGDIPKHLKTRIHANDNIPVMGTKGWFDLIYHDDPNYDYGAMKVKLEKQEARERKKLPPGMYPVGLVNLEDPPENSASSSHHNVAVAPQPDIIAVSEGDLPNVSHLEGLDNSDNLLHAINPGLPSSTESPLNIFPGSDGSFSVFAEDGLFSTFEVQESVIL